MLRSLIRLYLIVLLGGGVAILPWLPYASINRRW